MIDNKKVGVGIVTCNRKESYKRLLDAVKSASDVDLVATVKNFRNDYGDAEPSKVCNGIEGSKKLAAFQVDQKLGIAHNKNIVAKWLLDEGADHIFIVEDDILVKDTKVFQEYIDTAKDFRLQHLNFCRSFDTMITNDYVKPVGTVKGEKKNLDFFVRLSGDFSYFTANALRKAGLYDERYINALDHCEHTYRMSILGFYTPFYTFADIHESTRFIEDTGTTTTIAHDSDHQKNTLDAGILFATTYGKALNQIHPPTQQELVRFLQLKHHSQE